MYKNLKTMCSQNKNWHVFVLENFKLSWMAEARLDEKRQKLELLFILSRSYMF